MINIYLLRHGKVDGDAALYGHTDIPVSVTENRQLLTQLQSALTGIKEVQTSPLIRCQKLAEQYAHLHHCPLTIHPVMREMHFGDIDGVPFKSMTEQEWLAVEPFWSSPSQHRLPNAESLTDFHARIVQYWKVLAAQSVDTLVVTHGGVIRMILAHLLAIDWTNAKWYSTLSIQNGSLTHIQINPDMPEHILVKTIGASIKGATDE
ncbi:histidine phosphatase family protein [Vibrio sp. E150_011]